MLSRAILVTGGAGFIGTNLVRRLLLDFEEKIIVIDNFRLGRKENLVNEERVIFYNIDLSNENDVNKLFIEIKRKFIIEEVWHMAANSDIPAGIKDPKVDFDNTFLTTYNLTKVLNNSFLKKFHFASSSAIYGDHGSLKIKESTAPLFPISNYGSFKLASEAILSSFIEKNECKLYLYRFPNVVGIPATHGVIFDFIFRLIDDPEVLNVLGNGKQRKQYIYISDLIEAMIIIKSKSLSKRNVFNIGPLDDGIKVEEIANLTVSKFFKGANIKFGDENRGWIGDIPKYKYSVKSLLSLGWTPEYTSHEAVNKAIEDIANQLISKKS